MISAALDELARWLAAYGVRGRAARRVLAETSDHLAEVAADVGAAAAIERFGAVEELARAIAVEVATSRTRSAVYTTFFGLAPAGIAYAVLYLSFPSGAQLERSSGSVAGLGALAFSGMVFLPQIAFVSGVLALVRAARTRSRAALSAAELRVQRARAMVASTAGVLTLACLAVFAVDQRRIIPGWWVTGAVFACSALLPPLAAAGVATRRASRPVVTIDGRADDVFDDLAPLLRLPVVRRYNLPAHPWRFAILVGLVAALCVGPFAGPVGAVGELVVLLVCFAVLGRPLGLRPAREDDETGAEPAAGERPLQRT